MNTRHTLDWNDMDTAPRNRPVWVRVGRYERIATWRSHEDSEGGDWFFDSKQVNHWFYRGAGQLHYISAWAELRDPDEQDPANLGKPRGFTDPVRDASPEAPHTHLSPPASPACDQQNAQPNFVFAFEQSETDHPSELAREDQPQET